MLKNAVPYVPYRNGNKGDIIFGNKLFQSTMLGLTTLEVNKAADFCVEELSQVGFNGTVPYDCYTEQIWQYVSWYITVSWRCDAP